MSFVSDLRGATPISLLDGASVSLAREEVRRASIASGLGTEAAESLAIVASELARNALVHARRGHLYVREVVRGSVRGVEVVVMDAGPGLADLALALRGEPRARAGMGHGLAGVSRLADELDFDVRIGEGTCVRARKFAGRPPYRSEIGIFSRPRQGESVNGDDATFWRTGEVLLIAVADGLGHGEMARRASGAAMECVLQSPVQSPVALVRACDAALEGTRGAAMLAARLDRPAARIELCCVGNLSTQIVSSRAVRHLTCQSGIVGSPREAKRVEAQLAPIGADELLVIFSDGIESRVNVADELERPRQHPIVVAEHVLAQWGRAHDDATVVVAS